MHRIVTNDAANFVNVIEALKNNKTYSYHQTVSSSCQNRMIVEGEEKVNFISNNYLGFSTHPKVLEAVKQAIDTYGIGIGGSPLMCGTTELHLELIEKIANVYEQESAVLFASGYQALLGSIQASVGPNDIVLLDQLVHRSIVDGVTLAGCKKRMWIHNDVEDLEEVLQAVNDKYERKLIIVDSVYSMDGDIAPLPEIDGLRKKYNAMVLVDEAHSLGVIGEKGYGILSHFDMPDGADLVSGTFSKFAGAIGGFAAGPKTFIEYLKHVASPYIFSASLSPLIVAGVSRAFDLLDEEPEWVERIRDNILYFIDGCKNIGLDIGPTETAVVPLMIRDNDKTQAFNKRIFEMGVYGSPVVYPAVAPSESRIRLGVMATHTKEDLDFTLDVFKTAAKEIGLV